MTISGDLQQQQQKPRENVLYRIFLKIKMMEEVMRTFRRAIDFFFKFYEKAFLFE